MKSSAARQTLMGLESEYAVVGIDRRGVRIAPAVVTARILKAVQRHYPHLLCAERAGSVWLGNGSRFYLELGDHPEGATPECRTPYELVRYARAMDRMVAAAAGAALLPEEGQVLAFANNVDYSARVTWGCHENYLCRNDIKVARQLVPFLVSRIVLTGGGGLSASAELPQFSISPRTAFIRTVTSGSPWRSIYQVKGESLASGSYRRVHVTCGERLRSDTSELLRFGLTAIVVAMADAGVSPEQAVGPADPVGAIKVFARDVSCTARVRCGDGRARKAIEILRHYLEHAADHAGRPWMPPWTNPVVNLASDMLDRLESRGVEGVDRTLDWATKHSVFTRYLRDAGSDWPKRMLAVVDDPTVRAPGGEPRTIAFSACAIGEAGKMMRLRDGLRELDWRFGQLGGGGLFVSLERQGALDHHQPGIDDIERAMREPPRHGRARVRGEWVSRHAGTGERFKCSWTRIVDTMTGRVADLSDPFAHEVRWDEPPHVTTKSCSRARPRPAPPGAGDRSGDRTALLRHQQIKRAERELFARLLPARAAWQSEQSARRRQRLAQFASGAYAGVGCPACQFTYGWNGQACGHCGFSDSPTPP